MAIVDMDKVAEVIREIAARDILPRYRNLQAGQIETKTHANDLVTIADVEAEKAFIARLPGLLPGSVVVGEEGAHADPDLPLKLRDDVYAWIVDPVDGTANFARNDPNFGVIVALTRNGERLAGWIFDPLKDRMFAVEKGAGVTINGVAVEKFGPPPPISRMRGQMACKNWREIADKVGWVVQIGSAAHVYMRLAERALDFAAFLKLYPWDNAAGTLMYEELGGVARHLDDGSAYDLTPSRRGLLMAPNDRIWEDMVCDVRHTYRI